MQNERELSEKGWIRVGHPGYFGGRKNEIFEQWDSEYGKGNWKIEHFDSQGDIISLEGIIYGVYVAGYVDFFRKNPDIATHVTENYSHVYDKSPIERELRFTPLLGKRNEFHHVAINIALEWILGREFQGSIPLQAREGKYGTDESTWPEGWFLSPGRIPCTKPDLIPSITLEDQWWRDGMIEDFYQKTKAILIYQMKKSK